MKRSLLLATLAMVIAAPGFAPAHAAVTCTFSGGVITVDVSPPETFVAFLASAGTIQVHSDPGQIPCGDPAAPPTVTNTDTVRVTGNSPLVATFVDMTGGPFAPGMTAEPDGTSEIEFEINLSASPDANPFDEGDLVVALGTSGADVITTTVAAEPLPQGINLNGAEPV